MTKNIIKDRDFEQKLGEFLTGTVGTQVIDKFETNDSFINSVTDKIDNAVTVKQAAECILLSDITDDAIKKKI